MTDSREKQPIKLDREVLAFLDSVDEPDETILLAAGPIVDCDEGAEIPTVAPTENDHGGLPE